MSWLWDAPTGVYKNHELSSDIRREAVADTMFMKFVRPEKGYGKNKGESITITRILQLPLASRVNETDRLPSGRPIIQTRALTVSEWGFKTEITEFEKNLTFFDITNQFQMMLRDQLTLTLDKMVADAMRLTPVKYIPTTPSTGTLDTDGTASTTATSNLAVGHLREIFDDFRARKVPTFRGGKYVGILSTKAARGIKNDPEYREWQAPTTASPFLTGQLKDIEGFSLYETNHLNALSDTLASGVLGEAMFFGADQAVLIEVMTPEMRAGIPADLGRFREFGWVGELDAGLIWETASLARITHVTSA